MSKRFAGAVVAGLALVACGESTGVETEGNILVPVFAWAASPDTMLSGVTVSVSGPGIPEPLVFGVAVDAQGQASALLDVPAGPDRAFIARGFIEDIEAYRGADTVDVTGNTSVSLILAKVVAEGTVTASIEDYDVFVDDAATYVASTTTTTAAAGSTADFAVRVAYANDAADGSYSAADPVEGAVVSWGSDNPGIATVDSGTCTTLADGTCAITATVAASAGSGSVVGIVASYEGIAHRVDLTVQ